MKYKSKESEARAKKARIEFARRSVVGVGSTTHPHVISVEGRLFRSSLALKEARKRGYDGSSSTFFQRIKNGMSTWAELAAPVNKNRSIATSSRQSKAKMEMAAVIAELDKRKAAAK